MKFIALIFAFSFPALAVGSPANMVRDLAAELRQVGTLEPLVNAIDWEYHYEQMEKPYRKALKVGSASDLKAYYERRVKDPTGGVLEKMKANTGKVSGEQREMLTSNIYKLEDALEKQLSDLTKTLKVADWSVVGVKELDEATNEIALRSTINGLKSSDTVTLYSTTNGWKLRSGSVFNPLGDNGFSPLGALPEPLGALGRE